MQKKMNSFVMTFLVCIGFSSCTQSSPNLRDIKPEKTRQTQLKESNCKQVPSDWVTLTNIKKIEWLAQRRKMCKVKEYFALNPFLLDLIKMYLDERNSYNKSLIYNHILHVRVNAETFVFLHDDLLLLKEKYDKKDLQLEYYFILRTLFREKVANWEIMNLIFS